MTGWLRPSVALSLVVWLGQRPALAGEVASNSLTPHLDTLWLALYVLLGVLVALILWEVVDRMPRRVKIDAAVALPEPENDYIDPTKMKFAEPARPAAPVPSSFAPPPPPEPMARPQAAPAPPASDDDNPFRKLSKLSGEDDSPLAPARPPVPRSEPASIPVPPAPTPTPSPASSALGDSGGSSGGWADLLQRVRAGEPGSASDDSGGMQSRSAMPPMTEEEAAPSSSTAAWESLLKKSANDVGPAPDTSTVGGGDFQPRSIKLGGGGGGEEAPVVDPLRMALDNPSTDPDENLPDFVKKATRTIALDLKKGGEQTPPPPMPKTEG